MRYSISRLTGTGAAAQAFSEFVAAFGLLASHVGMRARSRPSAVPFAVGAYITAAYWFTASTSFANPAVTVARALTNAFAGVRPMDDPTFVVAQFAGALSAILLFSWLSPRMTNHPPAVLMNPQED